MTPNDNESLFELYQQWLEIPAERLPPNHYALLGIEDFESDLSVIDNAAKQRGAYLHQIAAGPKRKVVQAMLGQVANARRTLLDQDSKNAYDDSLRHPQPVSQTPQPSSNKTSVPAAKTNQSPSAGRSTTPPLSPDKPAAPKNSKASSTRPRKKNNGAWKFHAISAGVLLGIVGIVWLVNMGGGGRRAAQLASTETGNTSSQSNSSTSLGTTKPAAPKPEPAVSENSSQQPKRQAKATIAKSAELNSRADSSKKRARGAALNRGTGSGLLAGNSDLNDFLSQNNMNKKAAENEKPAVQKKPADDAEPPANPVTKEPRSTFQLPKSWRRGIKKVPGFPNKVNQQFSLAQKREKCFSVESGNLKVTPAKSERVRQRLIRKAADFGPGKLVSVTANLNEAPTAKQEFGFILGTNVIGVRREGNEINVYSQTAGKSETKKSLGKLPMTSAPFSLSILYVSGKQRQLRWVIDSDSNDLVGTVGEKALNGKLKYSLFFDSRKQSKPGDLILSQLMFGSLESEPEWK